MNELEKSLKLLKSVDNTYFLFEYGNGVISVKRDGSRRTSYYFGSNGIANLIGYTSTPPSTTSKRKLSKMLIKNGKNGILLPNIAIIPFTEAKAFIRRELQLSRLKKEEYARFLNYIVETVKKLTSDEGKEDVSTNDEADSLPESAQMPETRINEIEKEISALKNSLELLSTELREKQLGIPDGKGTGESQADVQKEILAELKAIRELNQNTCDFIRTLVIALNGEPKEKPREGAGL